MCLIPLTVVWSVRVVVVVGCCINLHKVHDDADDISRCVWKPSICKSNNHLVSLATPPSPSSMVEAVAALASVPVLEDLHECLCFGSGAWIEVFLMLDGLSLLLEVRRMDTRM